MAKRCTYCGKRTSATYTRRWPGLGTHQVGKCCKNLMDRAESTGDKGIKSGAAAKPHPCAVKVAGKACGMTVRGGVCPSPYH